VRNVTTNQHVRNWRINFQ